MLVKVNSDNHPLSASRFSIRSIPTMVMLRRGAEVKRLSGAFQAAQIVDWVAQPPTSRLRTQAAASTGASRPR